MVGLEKWWMDTPTPGIATLSVNRRATEGGFREPVHPLSHLPSQESREVAHCFTILGTARPGQWTLELARAGSQLEPDAEAGMAWSPQAYSHSHKPGSGGAGASGH